MLVCLNEGDYTYDYTGQDVCISRIIFNLHYAIRFLISINPNSIEFPGRPNRVQSARKRRKTRGRDQWIWLVNQRITAIESNRGEPSTALDAGRDVGEVKLKEQTEKRKIDDDEIKTDETEEKCLENERIREYGWRNGRERLQMRKSVESRRDASSQFAQMRLHLETRNQRSLSRKPLVKPEIREI